MEGGHRAASLSGKMSFNHGALVSMKRRYRSGSVDREDSGYRKWIRIGND